MYAQQALSHGWPAPDLPPKGAQHPVALILTPLIPELKAPSYPCEASARNNLGVRRRPPQPLPLRRFQAHGGFQIDPVRLATVGCSAGDTDETRFTRGRAWLRPVQWQSNNPVQSVQSRAFWSNSALAWRQAAHRHGRRVRGRAENVESVPFSGRFCYQVRCTGSHRASDGVVPAKIGLRNAAARSCPTDISGSRPTSAAILRYATRHWGGGALSTDGSG
jgi:hypothetical protein